MHWLCIELVPRLPYLDYFLQECTLEFCPYFHFGFEFRLSVSQVGVFHLGKIGSQEEFFEIWKKKKNLKKIRKSLGPLQTKNLINSSGNTSLSAHLMMMLLVVCCRSIAIKYQVWEARCVYRGTIDYFILQYDARLIETLTLTICYSLYTTPHRNSYSSEFQFPKQGEPIESIGLDFTRSSYANSHRRIDSVCGSLRMILLEAPLNENHRRYGIWSTLLGYRLSICWSRFNRIQSSRGTIFKWKRYFELNGKCASFVQILSFVFFRFHQKVEL